MGKSIIVALFMLTAAGCSLDCTAEDGTTVADGATYNDGCNTCVCTNGSLACDAARCSD